MKNTSQFRYPQVLKNKTAVLEIK